MICIARTQDTAACDQRRVEMSAEIRKEKPHLSPQELDEELRWDLYRDGNGTPLSCLERRQIFRKVGEEDDEKF